jgi:hypothetical protein
MDSQQTPRSACLCRIRVSSNTYDQNRFVVELFEQVAFRLGKSLSLHNVILQERNALKLRLQLQRVNRCNPGLGQYVIPPQHEEYSPQPTKLLYYFYCI